MLHHNLIFIPHRPCSMERYQRITCLISFIPLMYIYALGLATWDNRKLSWPVIPNSPAILKPLVTCDRCTHRSEPICWYHHPLLVTLPGIENILLCDTTLIEPTIMVLCIPITVLDEVDTSLN